MTIALADYIAGGYFLSRYVGPCWTGTKVRRVTLANDHSPRRFFPDSWVLSWCSDLRHERLAEASVFGIAEQDLDRVIVWGDRAFGIAFGAWSTFFTLDGARDAAYSLLTNASDLELWGVGLHRELLPAFCRASTPPPPVPGYSPMGASGVHEAACRRTAPIAPGCEVLGFELLVEDMGVEFNSPESLHLDEQGLLKANGVVPNAFGLIDSPDQALACCKSLDAEITDTRPRQWFPWLLVRYPLRPTTEADF